MPQHPLMASFQDPFPSSYQMGSFYEFDASQPLELKSIEAAYQQASCFVLRRVFDAETLSGFYERAKTAYQVRDWQFEHGELSEKYLATMYHMDHLYPDDMDDPTQPKWQIIKLFEQSCLKELAQYLLGPNVALLLNYCNPRRQRPLNDKRPSKPVPFHQDGAFMDNSEGIINFWTPLIDCGMDAPGLEVITQHPGKFLDPVLADGGEEGMYQNIDLCPDYIAEHYSAKNFWAPELYRGDVLVFTEKTLHRTHITPEMTQLRISAELRCADPATLTPKLRKMVHTRSFL